MALPREITGILWLAFTSALAVMLVIYAGWPAALLFLVGEAVALTYWLGRDYWRDRSHGGARRSYEGVMIRVQVFLIVVAIFLAIVAAPYVGLALIVCSLAGYLTGYLCKRRESKHDNFR